MDTQVIGKLLPNKGPFVQPDDLNLYNQGIVIQKIAESLEDQKQYIPKNINQPLKETMI
jgi:hypothetical protein